MKDLIICLGGDIVPPTKNQKAFCDGDIDKLIDDNLQGVLNVSDVNILNLETPLCDKLTPIAKCGPNLHTPSACVRGLRTMNITALGCANNHILDYGCEALIRTTKLCNEWGIDVFGIGKKLQEAAKPYIIEKNGRRVGVYACAEHEFSIATETCAGANPYDALYSFDHVTALKTECDYVIVMFHGGKEYYRYPSPDIQRICRRFVEKGADLVVTQHTHCIGCRENYKDGVIIYGQGNFLFDQSAFGDKESYANGLLLKITLSAHNTVEELPVILRDDGSLSLATQKDREKIITGYKKRSQEIITEGFVDDNYDKFALSYIEEYLRIPLGYLNTNIILRVLNRLLGRKIFFLFTNRRHRLYLLNTIECEAHRELFIRGLKRLIYRG